MRPLRLLVAPAQSGFDPASLCVSCSRTAPGRRRKAARICPNAEVCWCSCPAWLRSTTCRTPWPSWSARGGSLRPSRRGRAAGQKNPQLLFHIAAFLRECFCATTRFSSRRPANFTFPCWQNKMEFEAHIFMNFIAHCLTTHRKRNTSFHVAQLPGVGMEWPNAIYILVHLMRFKNVRTLASWTIAAQGHLNMNS